MELLVLNHWKQSETIATLAKLYLQKFYKIDIRSVICYNSQGEDVYKYYNHMW